MNIQRLLVGEAVWGRAFGVFELTLERQMVLVLTIPRPKCCSSRIKPFYFDDRNFFSPFTIFATLEND